MKATATNNAGSFAANLTKISAVHAGEPTAKTKLRQKALDSFKTQGFNMAGREDWKHSDFLSLSNANFMPFSGGASNVTYLEHSFSKADTHKLVFVNGIFNIGLSNIKDLPIGVTLCPLAQSDEAVPGQLAVFVSAPITALNTAFWQDGLYLKVDDGVQLDRPVELYFLTDNQALEAMVSNRNLIEAGKNSKLTVVEYFEGLSTNVVLNTPVTEINCQADSEVRHLKIIRDGSSSMHFGSTHVRQQARSSYTSREFVLGGSSVRRELFLDLDGEAARCDLTALYMSSAGQKMDMRTRVNHNAAGCQTNELYKGILDDKATTIFDGLIKVARDAQQTAAFQTNRNLVLSDDAVSYSIPRLEIYADDVKCSHGSTTGQLDDEQLFFLRTRGFDALTSRIMLANAFASEIVMGVLNADLRDSLTNEISSRLSASSVARTTSEAGATA